MTTIELDKHSGYLEERGLYTRAARMSPSTVNEEQRSVQAVIASETPVRMFDWDDWEVVDEVLTMEGLRTIPDHIPLLDNHSRWSNKDVIGSCRDIAKEATQLLGRNYFARDVESDKIFKKVVDGHIRDNSIGYRVMAYEKLQPGESRTIRGREWTAGPDRPMKIATDWELRENSITPIGADSTAKMRSKMSELSKSRGSKVVETKEHKETDSERAAREARARKDQILAICPRGLESVADDCILRGLDLEAARKELIEAHAKKAKPVGTPEPTIEREEEQSDEDDARFEELSDESLIRSIC